MRFHEGNVFFCGVCQSGTNPGLKLAFQRALEEAGLSAEEFTLGPLSLWCGDAQPRGFARLESPQGLAVVAGELIWEGAGPPEDGPGELPRLLECFTADRPDQLAEANGTFAALAWDAAAEKLWLATDSLGGRPLYFAQRGGTLFFSTLLDVLLRIPALQPTFDFGAYIEQEAFCYPLGDLTLYREIRVLRDSELLCWTSAGVRRFRYFDWSRMEFRQMSLDEAADGCAAAFTAAIRDRAPRPGAAAKTLLSGGLDSRCINAVLHQMGVRIQAATLRIPDSQDYEYARRFAKSLGIELLESPYRLDVPRLTTGLTTRSALAAAAGPLAPGYVFSGDGGGETFGFLLLSPTVTSLLARGKQDDAIRAYLDGHRISARVFRRPLRSVAARRPEEALRRALGEYSHLPAEKAIHLFVILEDLRRHLHDFFEIAPQTGLELALPFYDRRVLRSVLRLAPPLEGFLEHRLYMAVLHRLPEICMRIPWQSYPGRPPCPIAEEGSVLKNQWELFRESAAERQARLWRDAAREFLAGRIPLRYVSAPALTAALALQKAGAGDYSVHMRQALAIASAFRAPARRRRDLP